MHVWLVGLSPVIIGGTVLHLLMPYIPVLPYWACSTEMVVPGGHFSVIISSSHAARWKVFRVPDNKAVQLKKPARQMGMWHRKHREHCINRRAKESNERLRHAVFNNYQRRADGKPESAIRRNRREVTRITGKRKHERTDEGEEKRVTYQRSIDKRRNGAVTATMIHLRGIESN